MKRISIRFRFLATNLETSVYMERIHPISKFGILTAVLLILIYSVQPGITTISVVSEETNDTIYSIEENGVETSFAYGLQGYLIQSSPPNACKKPAPPPNITGNNATTSLQSKAYKWILLATLATSDDSCSLSRKAKNAQAAGYSAIIIRHLGDNNSDNALPGFIGLDWVGVKLYTCVIGDNEGYVLNNYTYPKKYVVKFENEPAFNAGFLGNITILVFFGVIGICVCVRGACYCYTKICHGFEERRRKKRTLLIVNELNKLPIVQWVPELPQETCSICLENFVVKDQVRLLPCSHVFHVQCIDPWLVQARSKCPNCKRRAIFLRESYSDSESRTTLEDENEPLLRNPLVHPHFNQTLDNSHNDRLSQPCYYSEEPTTIESTVHSSKGCITPQSCLQGPNVFIGDVSVHSENDASQITQSTSTTCLSISQDLSSSSSSSDGVKQVYKPANTSAEQEDELMGKSYSTVGTNDETLSFHSCREIESDRDELYSSVEQAT